MRLLVILGGLVALGLCLAPTGSGAKAGSEVSAGPCGPAGAHTLAASGVARVYSLGGQVYGCSGTTGKTVHLGRSSVCEGGDEIGPAAVAGELAAYGAAICGVDTGSASVVVRRLSDGKQLLSEPATTRPLGPESYQWVDSVVAKSDGAIAWIGVGNSIIGHGPLTVEVFRATAHGRALLDSGESVDPRSLRLHGSKLTWKDDGAARSATLH
jgi:hypothetical protein